MSARPMLRPFDCGPLKNGFGADGLISCAIICDASPEEVPLFVQVVSLNDPQKPSPTASTLPAVSNYVLGSVGYFISFAYYAVCTRFFALYLLSLGCSPAQIATLAALGKVSSVVLASPVIGSLADRLRSAKAVLLVLVAMDVVYSLALPQILARTVGSVTTLERGVDAVLPADLFLPLVGFVILKDLLARPQMSLADALIFKVAGTEKWAQTRLWGALSYGATNGILGVALDKLLPLYEHSERHSELATHPGGPIPWADVAPAGPFTILFVLGPALGLVFLVFVARAFPEHTNDGSSATSTSTTNNSTTTPEFLNCF